MNNVNEIQWWHRIKLPDGTYTPGIVRHGPDGEDWPTTRFGLPTSLTGKTILDIGAWDGFFSFEAEKRGAEYVLAMDNFGNQRGTDGFQYAKNALGSRVQYVQDDIQNPKFEGQFDVVLFFGVLYHLKSPLIAMENVAKYVNPGGICLLETAMAMEDAKGSLTPCLEYHPGFEKDDSNCFYPNEAWIEEVSYVVGFKSCEHVATLANRATYRLTK